MNDKIELPAVNVAGVQFRPANVIDPLVDGQTIRLVAEPENPYDRFAIKVEALTTQDVVEEVTEGVAKVWQVAEVWQHIGYIPKKSTYLFHLLRQANIKIHLALLVNHAATDKDKLLVSSWFVGDKDAAF